MLEDFLSYLRYEKNYSHHTVISYGNDLKGAKDYLAETYGRELHDAEAIHLRSWMVHLMESGLAPSSVHRKVSALKSFFKWRRKKTGITADPTSKLILPKKPRRLPTYIEESSTGKTDSQVVFESTFEGARDEALIELLYHTGIRSAELIELRQGDLDWKNHRLRVTGKRNKERVIPFGDSLREKMKAYLQRRSEITGSTEEPYFFLTKRGKKLYPKLVYRVVNDYISKVSSINKKSPHVLRHTFATHMLNNGADINAIKDLLGHSSLAATQVYTHNSVDKLIKVYRKAHPKG
jgi:integrase/recombinase XerC